MSDHSLYRSLATDGGKIVLLVMDGLGGIPIQDGRTELELARTPHLDELARTGVTGLSTPVRPGIEPGSGPAHLALFGFDPVEHQIGRGVLEALGIDFPLGPRDLAARGNFATTDVAGVITDRRAGRISTAECERLTDRLQTATVASLSGCEVFVLPVRDYRFVLVMRGEGLGGDLTETDPGKEGLAPLPVTDRSSTAAGQRTADLVNRWLGVARAALHTETQANNLNLRGLSFDPGLPSLQDLYGLRSGGIAVYPMYRGVARLVGMEPVLFAGETPADQFRALAAVWDDFDFTFVHIKKTDSYGEDGNLAGKIAVIEEVDAALPALRQLDPDVLIVTGDHSTPVALRSHSWHPVPTILWAKTVRPDSSTRFGESACAAGSLGHVAATSLLPLALAHAGRLKRFGA